jgi:hypothetical protein
MEDLSAIAAVGGNAILALSAIKHLFTKNSASSRGD